MTTHDEFVFNSLDPRVAPPLNVFGRPIAVEWRVSRNGGSRWRGSLRRDALGNCRVDYGRPASVSRLWRPAAGAMTWLSHRERTARICKGAGLIPQLDDWAANGGWAFRFGDERRIIGGLDCVRVHVRAARAMSHGAARDEVWVAPEWGLVLLEELESARERWRWEILALERVAAPPEAFEIPAGYTLVD